jgi:hypothetical protein
MPTRLIFGPSTDRHAAEGTNTGPRADAITVTDDLDQVAKLLRTAEGGWAEFVMQVTAETTRRVFVNAACVRYIREFERARAPQAEATAASTS